MSNFKSLFCLMRPLIQIKLCPLQTLKGYECTKTLIATLLRGLKGLKMYKAGVALKRKIAFPRFNTMKVWKRDRTALVQICITLLTSVLAVLPCASRRHKTELKWHFMNLRVCLRECASARRGCLCACVISHNSREDEAVPPLLRVCGCYYNEAGWVCLWTDMLTCCSNS